MIIITGGAGFIGSNLVAGLNNMGHTEILVVDDLTDGRKCLNLADLSIADYLDKADLFDYLNLAEPNSIEAIFHLGACSATTEWNGQFLMKNNYEFSKNLFHWCQDNLVPFIYASSASVYGLGERGFSEKSVCEDPINAYAFSKLMFDRYVFSQNRALTSQVVGLRYFNVYGPRENHKDNMVSPAYSFFHQIKNNGISKIFESSHGYSDGDHERDFVYVGDCVKVNLWFLKKPKKSGLFNVGTGCAASFNQVCQEIINYVGYGSISYIPFPEHLKKHYQSYTQADISSLRSAGYDHDFKDIKAGMKIYCKNLSA